MTHRKILLPDWAEPFVAMIPLVFLLAGIGLCLYLQMRVMLIVVALLSIPLRYVVRRRCPNCKRMGVMRCQPTGWASRTWKCVVCEHEVIYGDDGDA